MATKATLTIRQARVDEFDQVMDFYTKMIDEMRDTDFDVCWEHGVHPSPAFLRASVDAGEAYVGLVDAGADGTEFIDNITTYLVEAQPIAMA